MGKAPKPLSDSLCSVLDVAQWRKIHRISQLKALWPELVGPMLARHTEPMGLDGKTLCIAADHPAMGQHVRMLQKEILSALRKRDPDAQVHTLRVFTMPHAGIKSKSTPNHERTIPFREKKAIAQELAVISRRDLRYLMYRARVAQLIRDKQR